MGVPSIIDNFFGKKMGNMLMDVVSDINPVRLNKANTAQKGPDIGGNLKAVRDLVKNRDSNSLTLKDYWAGKKIGASRTGNKNTSFTKGFVDRDGDSSRATVRAVGAGSVAAYGLSPMVMGDDNPFKRTVEAGAAFGAHAGITAASIRAGGGAKMFGVAYGGIAAFNAIRSGDNTGPF
jgi:hypothetical protein